MSDFHNLLITHYDITIKSQQNRICLTLLLNSGFHQVRLGGLGSGLILFLLR